MAEVFVSYTHEDEEKAEKVVQALEAQRWSVWWDKHLPPGKSYPLRIDAALKRASAVVVLWSEHSVKSNSVLAEVAKAYERSVLIPVRIDGVSGNDIPVPFNVLQYLDLSEWEGNPAAPEFQRIVKAIEDNLGRPMRRKAFDAAMEKAIPAGRATELICIIRDLSSKGLQARLEARPDSQFESKQMKSELVDLEFPVGDDGQPQPVGLRLRITAPDFDIPEPEKAIRVFPEGDTPECVFLMTPKQSGNLLVRVEVLQRDTTLFSAGLRTTVVDESSEDNPALATIPFVVHSWTWELGSIKASERKTPFFRGPRGNLWVNWLSQLATGSRA